MEIVYVYQKKRRDFGRQCVFTDRKAEILADIEPNPSLAKDYIDRNPADIAVQNTREFSEHEVNTETAEFTENGMNHVEGGWPRDVDCTEVEQVNRFRKKIEKDEGYQHQVLDAASQLEHLIQQNNALDIYEDYFPEPSVAAELEPPSARTINVLRDPQKIARSANSLSWNPDGSGRLAVAYSVLEFQQAPEGMSYDSYIWNLDKPNAPEQTLSPSSPLVSLQYNPKDVHVLLGGCYNGQIALWDVRKGSRPMATTPIEASHRDPVHGLCYMSSKTGTEFFSTSTDGQVMWWDSRKLDAPTEVLQLDVNEQMMGGIVADFESTMPTRFMVGTEQGVIINGNRKGKSPAEKLASTFEGHHGPVYSIRRNPFSPKYFLSVGDWTARVWCEDVRESAVLWSKYYPCYLTCGVWSHTRPAVSFVGRSDGAIDVYDYLFKQAEAALTVPVSDSPVRSIAAAENSNVIAVGSSDGAVTLLELSDGLVNMQGNNEKAAMAGLLDRETSREKLLASRVRELALQQRIRSARPGGTQPVPDDDEEDPVAAAEKNFWSSVDPDYYEKQSASRLSEPAVNAEA
ncbi:uncharacterized protein MONBRDRAFT_39146 [Monosiga brevicollis MX1]|uniref:Dynein intermediate chain 3, ciliary n=1 Tax=Monosiga brevicollis TaxID=81824 RepID=A9VCJ2_MONBE|nr:uncharacterized protein MONBRDRAFT_39146 [Monosiga brevicollis MX1]EDQ84795.1 predicted protein [Monosiga brevicollis MX1]|eukprot:XP_001750445.1 hypothetical protein [Monosiga brevicollis MX1]